MQNALYVSDETLESHGMLLNNSKNSNDEIKKKYEQMYGMELKIN
jgi:hypothetical protein